MNENTKRKKKDAYSLFGNIVRIFLDLRSYSVFYVRYLCFSQYTGRGCSADAADHAADWLGRSFPTRCAAAFRRIGFQLGHGEVRGPFREYPYFRAARCLPFPRLS